MGGAVAGASYLRLLCGPAFGGTVSRRRAGIRHEQVVESPCRWCDGVYDARTRRAADSPIAAAAAGSCTSERSAPASARGSSGGTRTPAPPSRSSGTAPTAVAIDGRPYHIASRRASGKPSRSARAARTAMRARTRLRALRHEASRGTRRARPAPGLPPACGASSRRRRRRPAPGAASARPRRSTPSPRPARRRPCLPRTRRRTTPCPERGRWLGRVRPRRHRERSARHGTGVDGWSARTGSAKTSASTTTAVAERRHQRAAAPVGPRCSSCSKKLAGWIWSSTGTRSARTSAITLVLRKVDARDAMWT